jgi:hypothetical protein
MPLHGAGKRRRRRRTLTRLLPLGLALLIVLPLAAQARDPEIRMYKMTHDGHTEKYLLFGKGDEPGCHNLPYQYHVYQVAIVGFASCSLFAEKDCQPDSIISAYWKGKDKPATRLRQGSRWMMTRDGSEADVRSWSCENR